MTVKKRLFWSNILMILVPVIVTTLIGVSCIGFIWFVLINGGGVRIHNQEDFEMACMAITEGVEEHIGKDFDFSSLEPLLENNDFAIKILEEGENIYSYGGEEVTDTPLYLAADILEGEGTIIQNGRGLYVHSEKVKGVEYIIYVSGTCRTISSYSELKTVMVFTVIIIAFTIFLSILMTNRFLTKFVLRKIEEPLDILAGGVHEIRDGNLEYRIQYEQKDEFLPVCSDFNEMAERLKKSVDMLQNQERSRRELIAGISHDLRSPLTSIQAYVEGLLDGIAKTPEVQKKYLETIKGKAEDLAHIISQLFLFSKMELEEYPENPCEFRLDEKILETVLALKEEYEEKGLTVNMELEPVEICADPLYLHRIISNILENSLKYKKKEQGNVWISLVRTAEGAHLSFADDGPGVPEESLPHLFEVFYRSDPSRQNPNQGSGLGLAIVASCVQRMGGTIQAFCKEPCGLEICIEIPAR